MICKRHNPQESHVVHRDHLFNYFALPALTASFRSLSLLKETRFLGAKSIFSFVRGFMPVLAAIFCAANDPKPMKRISSPDFRESRIQSKISSIKIWTWSLERTPLTILIPHSSAAYAIISRILMHKVPCKTLKRYFVIQTIRNEVSFS